MNIVLSYVSTFSILLVGVIGLMRVGKIKSIYYPFIALIWIGIINEGLSFGLRLYHHNTILNNNIYVLIEACLSLWFLAQFEYRNKRKQRNLLLLVLLLFIVIWMYETFLLRSPGQVSIFFRIAYSFSVVLASIHTINKILLSETKNLLKNPLFLICLGFIFYFTLNVLVNAFRVYGLTKSMDFSLKLYSALIYLNLITNLLYAIALLWIPRKQPSLLPSL